jgi:uncharacterized membrane protein YdbT with pleckstrin-like domain
MSLVTKNLLQGEQVVFETRKHWIAPIRASLVAAALVVAAGIVSALLPSGGGFLDPLWSLVGIIRWIVLIGAVGWIAWNIVAWRTAEFAVTNLRVLRYEGLVQKRTSETLLSAISDVKLRVGFLGSKLDFGDLQIFTTSGAAGADEFNAIAGAVKFRNAMMDLKIQDQMARRAPSVPEPVSVAAPPPVVAAGPTADESAASLVALADLRDKGVITPEEFEAKKAEILSRI